MEGAMGSVGFVQDEGCCGSMVKPAAHGSCLQYPCGVSGVSSMKRCMCRNSNREADTCTKMNAETGEPVADAPAALRAPATETM